MSSLGCLRRLKVNYTYIKAIYILYMRYCESRSFLRLYHRLLIPFLGLNLEVKGIYILWC